MANADLISVIANVALTLSFIAAFIFGIAQVRAAERDRRERLTLETLRAFNSREFAELMTYLTWRELPGTREELGALPDKERIMLMQFSQQMESLGILVAERYINLDLVDKTLGSFVTLSWDKYKVLFLGLRDGDPFLGEYFQWLAEQIDERMKKNPRKPFYASGTTPHHRHHHKPSMK